MLMNPLKCEEINIVALGDIRYRFKTSDIDDIKYGSDFTIHFKDGSLIILNMAHVICTEFVKELPNDTQEG